MPFVVIFLLVVLMATPTSAAEIPPPSGERIVSAETRLELLFTRTVDVEGGLTEGPAVAPDGSIYFSDILPETNKGMILRFDPKTGRTTVFSDDSGKVNGLIFNADSDLIGAQGADYGLRRIASWNVETGSQAMLADRFQGKRFNAPNDVCLDDNGRIYFSDPRYLGHEPLELDHRSVYRVDESGNVVEITRDVSKPNGLALSPDGGTLYVADHDNDKKIMRILAFSLDADGLVKGPGRTLLDFGEEAGCDGMTVDEHGNLYLTIRMQRRPGVMVVNSDGKEVAFIPTGPAGQPPGETGEGLPSNVEFGKGAESHVLYITVDTSLYRIPLKVKGYHRQYR